MKRGQDTAGLERCTAREQLSRLGGAISQRQRLVPLPCARGYALLTIEAGPTSAVA